MTLPPWEDEDAVFELFRGMEESGDLALRWDGLHIGIGHGDDPPAEERLAPRRLGPVGRPRGKQMPRDRKMRRWPVHRMAVWVQLVEWELHNLYPQQKRGVRERACEVVARLWGADADADVLLNYVGRSKKHRGRIVPPVVDDGDP